MSSPVHKRIVIVGGGVAGLACAMKLAEEGVAVDLVSMAPPRRSNSASDQGGINAANDIARQQGYSEWMHFDETILGGDFLADQPPVLEMCNWAPRIIDLLDRMGVPFNRTAERQRALRMLGGSLHRRTFFAGATTGQQVLYALDEQVRRWEAEGRVMKYEPFEFLWPVVHEDRCCGVVVQDLRSMEMRALRADAVVIASGRCEAIFRGGATGTSCPAAAVSRCYQAGAVLGNAEMVQLHPTAIAGDQAGRVVSEAVRGEGGRIWTPRVPHDTRKAKDIPEEDRWYFLEERYPKYGNLVPRDIAAREILQVCQEGLGVGGGNAVYLDLRDEVARLGRHALEAKLGGALELHRKFVGVDPLSEPMKVYPAVHASLGGLWTSFRKDDKSGGLVAGDPANMATSLPGLYAMGEASFAYHGANLLGGNSLLSSIFDGLFGGACVKNYAMDVAPPRESLPQSAFDAAVAQEQERMARLLAGQGDENPHKLLQEMGRQMTAHCTVVRDNDRLDETISACRGWLERTGRLRQSDTGTWMNQNLSFDRAVRDMIILANAILRGARARGESRGTHFKPQYSQRDDERFLRTTIARYDPSAEAAKIEWGPVDISNIQPRRRSYGRIETREAPIPRRSAAVVVVGGA